MIEDLFSHKIHSSSDEWPDKLAELAAIFSEFDGQVYDRSRIEARLARISPRASYIGSVRDPSKFRDEISAYPAYLGLYHLVPSEHGWVLRMSETAKRYLLGEAPDVGSFLRLQLPLFQYPNAMGASYGTGNQLRLQANTRDRTLSFIRAGIHLSPVRLIVMALKADAALRGVAITDAHIMFDEVFALANQPAINQDVLPDIDSTYEMLRDIRAGIIPKPEKYETRFHLLRHMEMFETGNGRVSLRATVNADDEAQLVERLDAISNIDTQFNAFDTCETSDDIEVVIAQAAWGRYFDAVRILPASIIEKLATDRILDVQSQQDDVVVLDAPIPTVVVQQQATMLYPFHERGLTPPPVAPYSRRRELADPEATRIKMQRRNLLHKEMIDGMAERLRRMGVTPQENDHIDLLGVVPDHGTLIFEMKSGGINLLDQIRKGLSQLYEYRYRYQDVIGTEPIQLCMVLAEDPAWHIPWITDYLCQDRGINICWLEIKSGKIVWPSHCDPVMQFLKA